MIDDEYFEKILKGEDHEKLKTLDFENEYKAFLEKCVLRVNREIYGSFESLQESNESSYEGYPKGEYDKLTPAQKKMERKSLARLVKGCPKDLDFLTMYRDFLEHDGRKVKAWFYGRKIKKLSRVK